MAREKCVPLFSLSRRFPFYLRDSRSAGGSCLWKERNCSIYCIDGVHFVTRRVVSGREREPCLGIRIGLVRPQSPHVNKTRPILGAVIRNRENVAVDACRAKSVLQYLVGGRYIAGRNVPCGGIFGKVWELRPQRIRGIKICLRRFDVAHIPFDCSCLNQNSLLFRRERPCNLNLLECGGAISNGAI